MKNEASSLVQEGIKLSRNWFESDEMSGIYKSGFEMDDTDFSNTFAERKKQYSAAWGDPGPDPLPDPDPENPEKKF